LTLELGQRLAERYEIQDGPHALPVGEGYGALQVGLDRRVRVEVYPTHLLRGDEGFGAFRAVCRTVARVNHPGLAQLYDFGTLEEGDVFVVLQPLTGRTWQDWIAAPPGLSELLIGFDSLLDTLAHLHARGLHHGDLRPPYVHVEDGFDDDTRVLLSGFGLLELLGGSEITEQRGDMLDLARYSAPEVLGGDNPDPVSDIYSAGALLAAAFAGGPIFDGTDPRSVAIVKIQSALPRVDPRPGLSVPAPLLQAVRRALHPHRDERFRFAADLRAELRPFLPDRYTTLEFAALSAEVEAHDTEPGLPKIDPGALSAEDSATTGNLRIGRMGLELVGRARELAHLHAVAQEVIEQDQGRLVILRGELGVGKTSLVHALRNELGGAGKMQPHESVFTEGSPATFAGLRTILDRALRTVDAPRERVREAIEDFLGDRGLMEHVEAGALLDFMRPRYGEEDAEIGDGSRSFPMLEKVLQSLSAERPVLLILDNLQWGGVSTIEFLERLIVGFRLGAWPILVLATLRADDRNLAPDVRAGLRRLESYEGDEVQLLSVERLSDEAIHELVRPQIEEHFERHRIAQRCGGNPLFAHALARAVAAEDSRALLPDERSPPEVLSELLEARIDACLERHGDGADAMQRLLDTAAVLGMRFEAELLRTVHARRRDTGEDRSGVLESLLDEGLLVEVPGAGGRLMEFDHPLLRETLLEGLSARRLRRYHRLVAEVLEEGVLGPPERYAARLAQHHRAAGQFDRALVHLDLAAQQAEQDRRYRDFARLRAEQARLLDPTRQRAEQIRIWLAAARALRRCDAWEEAMEALGHTAGSDDPMTQLEVLLEQASVHRCRREWALAIASLDTAEARLDQISEGGSAGRRQRIRLERARIFLGRGERSDCLALLVRIVGEDPAPRLRGEALYLRGRALRQARDPAAARADLEEALQLARELEDESLEAEVALQQGLLWSGGDAPDLAQAERCLEGALSLAQRSGRRTVVARSLRAMAVVLSATGRHNAAADRHDLAARMWDELGLRDERCTDRVHLAICHLLADRPEEGLAVARAAADSVSPSSSAELRRLARWTLAAALARSGAIQEARAEVDGLMHEGVHQELAAPQAPALVLDVGAALAEGGWPREAESVLILARQLASERGRAQLRRRADQLLRSCQDEN
jgi:tetratricopeptide (TPR) repeat protein